MIDAQNLETFRKARPTLLGLAYRILGSYTEAEDAVQDTYLKWEEVNKDHIQHPPAWLTTVCTRRCIDLLQAAHKTRVNYIGTWLPEPVHTRTSESPEDKAILASSLTTAFLLLLERLTPKERATYLLYEIFDCTYAEISETLNLKEDSCRKLVSRARLHLEQSKIRYDTDPERQEKLLAAFQIAIQSGATNALGALLSEDIALGADSNGRVIAVKKVLHGKNKILKFISRVLGPAWSDCQQMTSEINGNQGLIFSQKNQIIASVSFAFNLRGEVSHIYIMRNPDKLHHLQDNEQRVQ